MGDFNCCLTDLERWPVQIASQTEYEELHDLMVACNVVDLDCTGAKLTWSNRRKGHNRIEKNWTKSL